MTVVRFWSKSIASGRRALRGVVVKNFAKRQAGGGIQDFWL